MTTDLDDDTSVVRRESSTTLAANEGALEAPLRRESGDGHHRGQNGTVVGFALLGALAFVAGLAIPDGRAVLFAIAGIGGVAAVLAYGLEPERTVEARDATRVYETSAANLARLVETVDGTADRRYAPVSGSDPDGVRLVVPLADPPRGADPVAGDGGDADEPALSLEPVGAPFVAELERSLEDGLATEPERLAEQLTDALVHRFEFVSDAAPSVDAAEGRLEVAVADDAFGPVDRFDHPAVSTLACGLAVGLERPVEATVLEDRTSGGRLVTCRWEPAGGTDATDPNG
ncbi:hypothetical protein [Natronococcus sp.]|uniref:hypothetical protein n=1 Tax=Natronococcus sp. TaxID=35747 RepID=UPI003A4E0E5F